MIRKHTRFIPHLNETDILFNWAEASRIGAELALLAEELSRANQFPVTEVVFGMQKIFQAQKIEVSNPAMKKFADASRLAYRTEHSAYIVSTNATQETTMRRCVHVFLKFFRKAERQPFQTIRVVVLPNGGGGAFVTN